MHELTPFGGDEIGQGAFDAPLVVVPFPIEHTTSYGGGTAQGPAAILRASKELEFTDEETRRPYWSNGAVHTVKLPIIPADTETAVGMLEEIARPFLGGGQFVLTLGGEHSLTTGAVRALTRARRLDPADVGVLFFDAHLDLRNEYEGSPWSHACVGRRVLEDGHPVEWCGIRSLAAEEARLIEERGLRPYFAHEICGRDDWIDELVERLPETVYLSIDVDGLDPAFMPGTGTPEPGGLDYRTLLRLIRTLFARRRVPAADLVEVAPIPGQQVSEFTAAKIAAKVLGEAHRQLTE